MRKASSLYHKQKYILILDHLPITVFCRINTDFFIATRKQTVAFDSRLPVDSIYTFEETSIYWTKSFIIQKKSYVWLRNHFTSLQNNRIQN